MALADGDVLGTIPVPLDPVAAVVIAVEATGDGVDGATVVGWAFMFGIIGSGVVSNADAVAVNDERVAGVVVVAVIFGDKSAAGAMPIGDFAGVMDDDIDGGCIAVVCCCNCCRVCNDGCN